MTRGRGVSCGGRSGSGTWSQRGGRVKVKGLRSSRVLPVKTGVELVQSVWKRWVAAESCRFCLVLRDGLSALPHSMSVVGGKLILQLVLVLRFGSGNRPARVVLSPPELLVIATPEGSILSHELVFHLFREPRLVDSVDTDCPCGDARFHTEAYVGRHSVCVFVEIGTRVLKDAPIRALEAAAQCLWILGTPLFHGLFHRHDSFELLSVSGDQNDGVVVRFP